eukprot:1814075-Amphidinium_carterae.1
MKGSLVGVEDEAAQRAICATCLVSERPWRTSMVMALHSSKPPTSVSTVGQGPIDALVIDNVSRVQ